MCSTYGFRNDMGDYLFSLATDSQSTIYKSNSQRRAKLQLYLPNTVYLYHFVDIACKDKDDCCHSVNIEGRHHNRYRPCICVVSRE